MARPKKALAVEAPAVPALPHIAPPGSIAFDLEAADGPIRQALLDMEDAASTWRTLNPLARKVIELLKGEVEKAAQAGSIGLDKADKLVGSITSASKSLSNATANMSQALQRLVEIKTTLDPSSKRDPSKMSEKELRILLAPFAREFAALLQPPTLIKTDVVKIESNGPMAVAQE